jgi:hypothetical protein
MREIAYLRSSPFGCSEEHRLFPAGALAHPGGPGFVFRAPGGFSGLYPDRRLARIAKNRAVFLRQLIKADLATSDGGTKKEIFKRGIMNLGALESLWRVFREN